MINRSFMYVFENNKNGNARIVKYYSTKYKNNSYFQIK